MTNPPVKAPAVSGGNHKLKRQPFPVATTNSHNTQKGELPHEQAHSVRLRILGGAGDHKETGFMLDRVAELIPRGLQSVAGGKNLPISFAILAVVF